MPMHIHIPQSEPMKRRRTEDSLEKYQKALDVKSLQVILASFTIVSACKILLFPAYRSTDFLVHRHWKALTREFPFHEWYHDNVDTLHTLDYPPGFAMFEYFWANNPLTNLLIDRGILDQSCMQTWSDAEIIRSATAVTSPDLITDSCVSFMRSSVVASDVVLWLGAWSIANSCTSQRRWPVFFALVLHPALIWLDHVHFQYNGFLLGLLLLSLSCLLHGNLVRDGSAAFHGLHLAGAALFAVLLTMKHIYLTLALWYFAYLWRRYCIVGGKLSLVRLATLGVTTVSCLVAPFVPWLLLFNGTVEAVELQQQIGKHVFPDQGLAHDYWVGNLWALFHETELHQIGKRLFLFDRGGGLLTHDDWAGKSVWALLNGNVKAELCQIAKRLFPFDRGLVHDYWAGNVWAFWTAAQKILGLVSSSQGLLFTPSPLAVTTLLLVGLSPGVAGGYVAASRKSNQDALRSFTYSALASFMFAYHVHEKAILTTLLPLAVLHLGYYDAESTTYNDNSLLWFVNAFATLGLFPLLFQPTEPLLKVTSYMAYLSALCTSTTFQKSGKNGVFSPLRILASCMISFSILTYEVIPVKVFGRLEFVPLAVVSLVTAFGLFGSYCFLAVGQLRSITKPQSVS